MKIFYTFLLIILITPAISQDLETASVRTSILQMFEAFNKGDTAGMKDFFFPGTRLLTAYETKDGTPMLSDEKHEKFIESVGAPRENKWYEHLIDIEVNVDGRMACAWVPYSFYINDKLSHCGVNAFQLFKNSDGWKIVNLMDTRSRTGCLEK